MTTFLRWTCVGDYVYRPNRTPIPLGAPPDVGVLTTALPATLPATFA